MNIRKDFLEYCSPQHYHQKGNSRAGKILHRHKQWQHPDVFQSMIPDRVVKFLVFSAHVNKYVLFAETLVAYSQSIRSIHFAICSCKVSVNGHLYPECNFLIIVLFVVLRVSINGHLILILPV